MRLPRLHAPLAIVALAALAGIAAWQATPLPDPANTPLGAAPERIMGTTCRLLAVPPHEASADEANAIATRALAEAEAALRAVEAEMSAFINDSPVSRLNRAPPGQSVPLPPASLEVLRAGVAAGQATGGAFDVTCRPLLELWRAAGKSGQVPAPETVAAARARSNLGALELGATTATKRQPGVEVDLGGIAKGYAIDQATARMLAAGAVAGLVDVGGDLRVFGAPPHEDRWTVQVRNPFGEGALVTLRLAPSAVCTSGDYFRYVELEGRRYSHIVDPRTGYPAVPVHSATVVAPDATSADVWATALTVLGEAGLARLPARHEALLVLGDRAAPHAVATTGFLALVVEGPPFPLAATAP